MAENFRRYSRIRIEAEESTDEQLVVLVEAETFLMKEKLGSFG